MYTYKQIGNKYIISINTSEEIVNALNLFCEERKIKSGSITGLGAINEVTLRFFHPETKTFVDKTFREQMEISNLTGNRRSEFFQLGTNDHEWKTLSACTYHCGNS